MFHVKQKGATIIVAPFFMINRILNFCFHLKLFLLVQVFNVNSLTFQDEN